MSKTTSREWSEHEIVGLIQDEMPDDETLQSKIQDAVNDAVAETDIDDKITDWAENNLKNHVKDLLTEDINMVEAMNDDEIEELANRLEGHMTQEITEDTREEIRNICQKTILEEFEKLAANLASLQQQPDRAVNY